MRNSFLLALAFSEIRLFLKNHSLEFHEIWHENTLGNSNWSIEKTFKFNRGNFRYSSEPSTKERDLSVNLIKIVLTYEHRYKLVAFKL